MRYVTEFVKSILVFAAVIVMVVVGLSGCTFDNVAPSDQPVPQSDAGTPVQDDAGQLPEIVTDEPTEHCLAIRHYADSDGDGYGDSSKITYACEGTDVPGTSLVGGDCDDSDATVYPGAPELCDGKDNNCNGKVDEVFPSQGIYCVVTHNGVPTMGAEECIDGAIICAVSCQATEVCGNGVDDNCDGRVDEACECSAGETRLCYDGPVGTGSIGLCKPGTQTCESGYWGSCVGQVLPRAEVCDGLDYDCDGTVNTGCECTNGATQSCYSGLAATKNVGVCKSGTQSCVNGHWGSCQGEVLPEPAEICGDGLDNNCDGQADEGCKVKLLLSWTVPVDTVMHANERINLFGCWGYEDSNGLIVCEGPGNLPTWGVLIDEVTAVQCIASGPGTASVVCTVWVPHGKVLRFNAQYGQSSELYGCNVPQYGDCTNLPVVGLFGTETILPVSVKAGPGTYDANWQVSVP